MLSKCYSRNDHTINHFGGENLSLIQQTTWCLVNLCHGRDPCVKLDQIEVILPLLADLFYIDDNQTLINTTWSLAYLIEHQQDNNNANKAIKKIIEVGMCRCLVELLKFSNDKVTDPVLRVLANLVSVEDDEQTQIVLDSGLLTSIWDLLSSSDKRLFYKEAYFVLSNIAGGDQKQIQVDFNSIHRLKMLIILRYF